MQDTVLLPLLSVLWHFTSSRLISLSLPFFFSLTRPLSRSLALINSAGLLFDAFQAPSSYHRPGLRRRPEGYGLKAWRKRELSSLKDQDTSSWDVDWVLKNRSELFGLRGKEKLFYLLNEKHLTRCVRLFLMVWSYALYWLRCDSVGHGIIFPPYFYPR